MLGTTPEHLFLLTSAPSFEKLSFAHLLLHWKVILSRARSNTHYTSFSWQNVFSIVTRWCVSRSKDLVPQSRSGSLLSSSSLIEPTVLSGNVAW